MATLTQSQVYTIALLAGLPDAKKMAAIAMAESSGRTDVVNSIGCVGLWQINQPVHVKANPQWTQEWLKNPVNNAMAAKKILASQGLKAWEVYTNGMYLKYMGKPVQKEAGSLEEVQQASWWDPLNLLPGGGDGSVLTPGLEGVGDIADSVWGIAESMQKAAVWMAQPKNWLRIAYINIGGFIAIAAVISIASKTKAGAAVKRTTGNVAKGALSVAPGGGTIRGASRAASQAVKKKVTS